MTQQFSRRVDGYNRPFIVSANAPTARNAWVTINCPAGPGRIEGIRYFADNRDVTTVWSNTFQVIVDGVTVINTWVEPVMGTYATFPTRGPVKGSDVAAVGSNKGVAKCKLDIDYESTAVAQVQNLNNPNPTTMGLTVMGRIGR